MPRSITLMATAAAIAISGPTRADFNGLEVERVTVDSLGNPIPDGIVTLRVRATFSSPVDQLAGVFGNSDFAFGVTVTGGVFFDSPIGGDTVPSASVQGLPGLEELGWDSWMTIGNVNSDVGPAWPSGTPFSDQLILAPGTDMLGLDGATTWTGGAGGPGNIGWTVPPTLPDPGGGGEVPTPQTVAGNWSADRVLLMQLSVVPTGGGPLSITGTMGVAVFEGGVPSLVHGSFAWVVPAPGGIVLLATGLATRRRRR